MNMIRKNSCGRAYLKSEQAFHTLEKYCNELNVNVNSAIAIYESGSKKSPKIDHVLNTLFHQKGK